MNAFIAIVRRDLLLTPQCSLKGQSQRAAGVALVSNGWTNLKVLERVSQIVKAAAWKADVLGEILGTGDDARLVVRGEPHGLRLVELRILERSQSQQAVPQPGTDPVLGDVDLVAENQLQGLWQIARNRRFPAAA